MEAAAGNVRVGRMTVYKQGSGISGVSKELFDMIVECAENDRISAIICTLQCEKDRWISAIALLKSARYNDRISAMAFLHVHITIHVLG